MKTIVKLLLDKPSQAYLKELVELFKDKREVVCDHTTVYYSDTTGLVKDDETIEKMSEILPLLISPETYFLELFGAQQDCLVLRYDNPKVRELRKIFESRTKEVFNVQYPVFNPHITLLKNVNGGNLNLETPSIELIFSDFSWGLKE